MNLEINMAGVAPELDAQLRQLDEELEEGDITKKGYEKRRTWLLSQYGLQPNRKPLNKFLKHNEVVSGYTRPMIAITQLRMMAHELPRLRHSPVVPSVRHHGTVPSFPNQQAGASPRVASGTSEQDGGYGPVSHVQKFQEREMGYGGHQRTASNLSYEQRKETLGVPGTDSSPDTSRAQTLLSGNYAFNPEKQGEYVGQPDTRHSTMVEGQEAYFQDFTGQQRGDTMAGYGGTLHQIFKRRGHIPHSTNGATVSDIWRACWWCGNPSNAPRAT